MSAEHPVSFSPVRGSQLVSKAQTRSSKESVCAKGERTPDTLSYFRVLQVAVGSCWCAWVSAARRRGGGYKPQMYGTQQSAESRSTSTDNDAFYAITSVLHRHSRPKPRDGDASFTHFTDFTLSLGRENTRARQSPFCGSSHTLYCGASLRRECVNSVKCVNSPPPYRGFAFTAGCKITPRFYAGVVA